MKKLMAFLFVTSIAISSILLLSSYTVDGEEWGFFGHRKINRMSVFTLPPEMIGFYKKHIEFITDHAVDPDKRRYATKLEAYRHYIDVDHYGTYPFDGIPRYWSDALAKFTDIFVVTEAGDTMQVMGHKMIDFGKESITLKGKTIRPIFERDEVVINRKLYVEFFKKHIESQYYQDDWTVDCDKLNEVFKTTGVKLDCSTAYAIDELTHYGVNPWHLEHMQYRLTKAFQENDANKILRLSAEMGHYIGDAHVPLHTTENYNGQLTDQVGIHAFWESRLPELFANNDYNFFVGKAEYIENANDYFWDVILTSHSHLDSVLAIEKELSITYPQDQQFCYESRNTSTVRTQCKDYATLYHTRLDNMVETRMQDAVLSIGSSWFSAWVDAGQPDLSKLGEPILTEEEKKRLKLEEEMFNKGGIKGRNHDGGKF